MQPALESDRHTNAGPRDTATANYTKRLATLERVWWKRLLDVQAPYRWNLKRLRLGRVLDVGCGIGRNLYFLDPGSVGVDHNAHSVDVARSRGCIAYEGGNFLASQHAQPASFDTMLVAHVLEHMSLPDGVALIQGYLPYIKSGGRVVLITPQEAGYQSDSSHVEFIDFAKLQQVLSECGLSHVESYSFPFPRLIGRLFRYNEFIAIGRK